MKLTHSLVSALGAAFLGTADAALSGCPKSLAIQLTNVLQAGQIEFPYGSCEKLSSDEYVAGIARFSTKDGSAWKVINAYHSLTGGVDIFSQFDGVIVKNSGGDSSINMNGFCNAWSSVGADQKFWSAQGSVFEKDYYNPSQSLADQLGLKLSIAQAQLYDAAIAHGIGSSSDELVGMIDATNKAITADISGSSSNTLTISGYRVDELEWLKRFLVTRAKYRDVHGTKASIDSYTYMINNNEAAWGDKIYVLNDQGNEGDIDCNNSYVPYSTPDNNTGSSATPSSSSSSTDTDTTSVFNPYGDGDGDGDGDDDGDGDGDGDGEGNDSECYGYGANYYCGAGNSKLAYSFGLLSGLSALLAL
ncbi:hypothetical protein H4S00_001889 [Coemansia sp. D1744]|nr:hypothetical protein H4S00_001889 [Coemansia sp. D1744]